jgi:hypothetical protein
VPFIVYCDSLILVLTQTACSSLSLAEYVLRCVLYLGIIIALNFSVTQLRITLLHSPWVSTLSVQVSIHISPVEEFILSVLIVRAVQAISNVSYPLCDIFAVADVYAFSGGETAIIV